MKTAMFHSCNRNDDRLPKPTCGVNASLPHVGAWRCGSDSAGHVCSWQGKAVCAIEVRGVIETESCGGQP